MVMEKYLLDTCVFIDHFRGRESATRFLLENKMRIVVSSVVVGELIQGVKDKRELNKIIKFLTEFEEIRLDSRITKTGIGLLIKFCLVYGFRFLDALVAATVLEKDLVLVTDNVKHFEFVEGLKIVRPTGEV